MKRFKPNICLAFFITVLISLTSCTPAAALPAVTTPSVTASAEVTLPEKVRVKGAAWVAENMLAYYAEDGVHIRDVENGDGADFVVSDTFDIDKGADFALSPDGSRVCVLIDDVRGNDRCGIYEVRSGKLLLNVDLPSDFPQKQGLYNIQYGTGFLDENNLYLYSKFEIWLVDINTGKQKRITADPSDFYESSDKTGRDYFEWVYSPVMVDGKLYYSGIRNTDNISHLYCADQNGETEIYIDGNVGMLAAISNRGFLYEIEENNDRQTWFYNIKTGTSEFVFGESISTPIINGTEIGYIEHGTQENDFIAKLYNIDTKQTQSFPIYQAARDFPQEDHHQFGYFAGFLSNDQGYVFLFSVGHRSKTEPLIVNTFMSYSTKTEKVISIISNDDNISDGIEISPSGEYLWMQYELVTKNGYEIRVVRMDDFLVPDTDQ